MKRATVLGMLVLQLGWLPGRLQAQETGGHGTAQAAQSEVEGEAAAHAGASEAHGESTQGHDDGHAAVPWYKDTDLWKFINLSVMFLIALRFGAGAIGPKLHQRGRQIRTDLDEARVTLEGAEKRLDDAEFRLARLHDELEEMRQDGRKRAVADQERIVAEARTAAEEIGRKMRAQIEMETRRSKQELRQFVAGLVVERVRQDLQQRVEREGDAPFVRTILEKVEALAS